MRNEDTRVCDTSRALRNPAAGRSPVTTCGGRNTGAPAFRRRTRSSGFRYAEVTGPNDREASSYADNTVSSPHRVALGKSFLTDLMPRVLTAAPHNLRLASLSLDDLYLPHKEQADLASRYPSNRMLSGRGQPGTHDLPLAVDCLRRLASINESPSSATIELPVYDKSRFSGKGDRSESTTSVVGPIDVVIFEGWATGFHSISSSELQQRYQQAQQDPAGYASTCYAYDRPFFLEHELSHLEQINDFTKQYQRELWPYLNCFVQLKPEDMGFVWKWRLQQEHNMKAKNGGMGMSDDEVKAFIGR